MRKHKAPTCTFLIRLLLNTQEEIPKRERSKQQSNQLGYIIGFSRSVEQQTKPHQPTGAGRLQCKQFWSHRKTLDTCNTPFQSMFTCFSNYFNPSAAGLQDFAKRALHTLREAVSSFHVYKNNSLSFPSCQTQCLKPFSVSFFRTLWAVSLKMLTFAECKQLFRGTQAKILKGFLTIFSFTLQGLTPLWPTTQWNKCQTPRSLVQRTRKVTYPGERFQKLAVWTYLTYLGVKCWGDSIKKLNWVMWPELGTSIHSGSSATNWATSTCSLMRRRY